MDFKYFIEFFIAAVIIFFAIYIIYVKIRDGGKECRNCGSCSRMCPRYKNRKNTGK